MSDYGYFHGDLHSLGYCVDPEYHHLMDDMPPEVWNEFVRCATRMLKAAPSEAGLNLQNLLREYGDYQNLIGSFSPDVLALARLLRISLLISGGNNGANPLPLFDL